MSNSGLEGIDPQRCAGPNRATRKPVFKMPSGACDTHAHVFGPQINYPFSSERSYTPEDCSVEQYQDILSILGIDRTVLVQGGPHGTDNRVTLNAIKQLGSRARGVAVIRPGLSPDELRGMHANGIRGFRISTVVRGGAGFEHLETLARETFDLGWHALLHLKESAELLALEPRLLAIPNSFVVDHLGHVTGAEGVDSQGFKALMRLLDNGRCWIKFASLYRSSYEPHPYLDMLPMIRQVINARPDRVIWGTNWPHPIYKGEMPNDGDLVDLIPMWLPDLELQQQVLVANPAKLYGFEDRKL